MRNFGLMRVAGAIQNLKGVVSEHKLLRDHDRDTDLLKRELKLLDEIKCLLDDRVKRSYMEFLREYNANQSPK